MPMLGEAPWTKDGKVYIRKSLAVEQGHQALWCSKDGGYGLRYCNLGDSFPHLVNLCDTIVLHPLDYEAVKKSMQDTPKRDRARQEKRQRGHGDLQGFDAVKHFRERASQERDNNKE